MWVDKAIHRSHKEMWARKTPVAPKTIQAIATKAGAHQNRVVRHYCHTLWWQDRGLGVGNQAVTMLEACSLLARFHSHKKVLSWLIGEHCYYLIPLQIPGLTLPTCQAMKKKLIVTGFVAHYTEGNSSLVL